MITLIPALRHSNTAYGTEALGGSIRETRPMNEKLSIGKLNFSGLEVENS